MKGFLWFFILVFVAEVCLAQSDYTLIIVNESTNECKVLEGYDPELELLVPLGWESIVLNQQQCFSVVPVLKKRKDLDPNIQSYIELLDCSKDTTVRSLSYFGRGAKEICRVAGYDFSDARIIFTADDPVPVEEKKAGLSPFLVIFPVVIIIFIFLILIAKKKKLKKY